MDFLDVRLEFQEGTKLGIQLLKKKVNVTRPLLDSIKTKQLHCNGHIPQKIGEDYKRKLWNGYLKGGKREADQSYLGWIGLKYGGTKRTDMGRLARRE